MGHTYPPQGMGRHWLRPAAARRPGRRSADGSLPVAVTCAAVTVTVKVSGPADRQA